MFLSFSAFLRSLSDEELFLNRVNSVDSRKRTLLHIASIRGDVGVVKGLLAIESLNVNYLDQDGFSPLGLAIREHKDPEVVNVLV